MSREEKMQSLMERIAEVANLSIELEIDLKEECMAAARKVLGRTFEMDDWDMQMILKGYTAGPTGVQ
jgi:flagellar biosynthesis/type III secretory pathway protein FliH